MNAVTVRQLRNIAKKLINKHPDKISTDYAIINDYLALRILDASVLHDIDSIDDLRGLSNLRSPTQLLINY